MTLVQLQNVLDNTTFVVLFAAMLLYWGGLAFPLFAGFKPLGTVGFAIANLTTATLLISRWLEGGYFPLSNLYESLFFLVWGVTAVHLFVERTGQNQLIGAVTAPVAMMITAFATLSLPPEMQASAPLVPALKSNWLMMHVSVMMLSYAALLVGSILAIAFLLVTRGQVVELKGSSVGIGGYRLRRQSSTVVTGERERTFVQEQSGGTATLTKPEPIVLKPERLTLADTLDNLSYRVIGLGFPLLTIGIIAGAVWANEAWGSYWSWDPKETWALITWLVFAAYLHARLTKGWQGRRPAILAALGFIVVWVCYLGVNLLGQGLHSYGWFL
ncbi:MAG: c-type cytochrome biogenesis protein CcsB [Cyanobacteria bacterium P01_H01_bin.15]